MELSQIVSLSPLTVICINKHLKSSAPVSGFLVQRFGKILIRRDLACGLQICFSENAAVGDCNYWRFVR